MSINEITKSAEQKMHRAIEAFKGELKKLRSGRAHPSLLEHVMVSYYGNETALPRVANVTIEDARTLVVTPWDKSMIGAIEKAIMTADLGLNPATSGTIIRVPLPALTEQRRKDMVKIVRQEAEQAKISIRNVRRDANTETKSLLKDKLITEDDERRAEESIQKLTDQQIKMIETLVAEKEQDLMSV